VVATCVTITLPEEVLVHTPPFLATPATATVGAVKDEPLQPLPPGYTPLIASTVDSST
jgi:hypothetical protein